MESVKISPKFQVVIPKNIRERYKFRAGEKVVIFPYDGRIEMVRRRDMKSMRGFVKGMDTGVKREDDRL